MTKQGESDKQKQREEKNRRRRIALAAASWTTTLAAVVGFFGVWNAFNHTVVTAATVATNTGPAQSKTRDEQPNSGSGGDSTGQSSAWSDDQGNPFDSAQGSGTGGGASISQSPTSGMHIQSRAS